MVGNGCRLASVLVSVRYCSVTMIAIDSMGNQSVAVATQNDALASI